MKLLLDTHVMLWAVGNEKRLSDTSRSMIADPEAQIFVSAISIWEIAIKHRLQRGRPNDMPIPGREALAQCEAAGFTILPITAAHAAAVDDLPLLHGDPFDRMLVAQAFTEPMRLLTRDARLAEYGTLVSVV